MLIKLYVPNSGHGCYEHSLFCGPLNYCHSNSWRGETRAANYATYT